MKKVLTLFFTLSILLTSSFTSSAFASETDTVSDLIKTAEKYIGTPYGGEFDCSGYINKVFGENGIEVPRQSSSLFKFGESINKDELQQGDLVFFNTSGKGISHVGMYIGNNKFIHSQNKKGVSTTSLNDPYYWGSRFVGAARVLPN